MDVPEELVEQVEAAADYARTKYILGRCEVLHWARGLELHVKREFCEWVGAHMIWHSQAQGAPGEWETQVVEGVFAAPGYARFSHAWLRITRGEQQWYVDPLAFGMGKLDLVTSKRRWEQWGRHDVDKAYELGLSIMEVQNACTREQYIMGQVCEVPAVKVQEVAGSVNRGALEGGLESLLYGWVKNRDLDVQIVQEMLAARFANSTLFGFIQAWMVQAMRNVLNAVLSTGRGMAPIESALVAADVVWRELFGVENAWIARLDTFRRQELTMTGRSEEMGTSLRLAAEMRQIGRAADCAEAPFAKSHDMDRGGMAAWAHALWGMYERARRDGIQEVVSARTKLPTLSEDYPSCVRQVLSVVPDYHLKMHLEKETEATQIRNIIWCAHESWRNYFRDAQESCITKWFDAVVDIRIPAPSQTGCGLYEKFWAILYHSRKLDGLVVRKTAAMSSQIEADMKEKDDLRSGRQVFRIGGKPMMGKTMPSKISDASRADCARVHSALGTDGADWTMQIVPCDDATAHAGHQLNTFLKDLGISFGEGHTNMYELAPLSVPRKPGAMSISELYGSEAYNERINGSEIVIPFLQHLYGKDEGHAQQFLRHLEWAVAILSEERCGLEHVYVPWPREFQLAASEFVKFQSEEEEWVYCYERAQSLLPVIVHYCTSHQLRLHFVNRVCLRVGRVERPTDLGTFKVKRGEDFTSTNEIVDCVLKWLAEASADSTAELVVPRALFVPGVCENNTKRARPAVPLAAKHVRSEYPRLQSLLRAELMLGMAFINIISVGPNADCIRIELRNNVLSFFFQQLTGALRQIKMLAQTAEAKSSKVVMSRGFLRPEVRNQNIAASWRCVPWEDCSKHLAAYVPDVRTTLKRLVRREGYALKYHDGLLYLRPTVLSAARDTGLSLVLKLQYDSFDAEGTKTPRQQSMFAPVNFCFRSGLVALQLPERFVRWFERHYLMYSDERRNGWNLTPFSSLEITLQVFYSTCRKDIVRVTLNDERWGDQRTGRFGNFEFDFKKNVFGDSEKSAGNSSDLQKKRRERALALLVAFAEVKDDAVLSADKIQRVGEALACYRFYQMESALDQYPEIAKHIPRNEYSKYVRREYLAHHSHSPSLTAARIYFDPHSLLHIAYSSSHVDAYFEV